MDYPIQPEHIKTDAPFENLFDEPNVEIAAHTLVTFAQQRGQGWIPFTEREILEYWERAFEAPSFFWFRRLVINGLIKVDEATPDCEIFSFTHHFIAACFVNSSVITACF